jgi:hypothetical protein
MPAFDPNFSRLPIQIRYEGMKSDGKGGFVPFHDILNYYEFRSNPKFNSEVFKVN